MLRKYDCGVWWECPRKGLYCYLQIQIQDQIVMSPIKRFLSILTCVFTGMLFAVKFWLIARSTASTTTTTNYERQWLYRKPTHTDRLLDQSSYNPTSHKATTIKTLTRRAQLVCDTPNSLCDVNKYLERVFQKNNYNADFIKRNTYRPSEADETNRTAYTCYYSDYTLH